MRCASVREPTANVGTQLDPDVTSALIGHLYGRPPEPGASAAAEPMDRDRITG